MRRADKAFMKSPDAIQYVHRSIFGETLVFNRKLLFFIIVSLPACGNAVAFAEPDMACPPTAGLALQVLGSGGPVADDGRASSAYLVWVDGKSRVLIDAGGGTFLRFGEAGARFGDLDFVGLSHFHTDHSADFPALLKSGYFSRRTRPLAVAGPDGNGRFPGLVAWLDAMLAEGKGAYAYLGGYLDGTGGLVRIVPTEVARDAQVRVFENASLTVDAMHVPHGIVPALAFRVRAGGKTIVFAGDQNLSRPEFLPFARDADVLVLHMALPEGATSGTQLHAVPSRIGKFAAEAAPGTVLLSHFMARSLRDLDGNAGEVKSRFGGKLLLAEDLLCVRS